MPVKITMPMLGITMEEGKIIQWLKKEGDILQKGDDLFELETEKIVSSVESPADGILFQIVISAGKTVPVGTIVALIAEPGEKVERITESRKIEQEFVLEQVKKEFKTGETEKFILSSPAARSLAKTIGIDLAKIKGSGPGGRIVESDISYYYEKEILKLKTTPVAGKMIIEKGLDKASIAGTGIGGRITKVDVQRCLEALEVLKVNRSVKGNKSSKSIPFSGMRRSIAENMKKSLQNTAQLTHFIEVDVTELVRFRDLIREEYRDDETIKISINDIIIFNCAKVLKRFPMVNSKLIGDEIRLCDTVNMGIAVSLPEGLIVPVLKNADKKGLFQISAEAKELARKAREDSLSVDDVSGGTFTISNTSMFEVDGFTPILRAPETGILGVGRVVEKPAVFNKEIVIRSMMWLSLSYDHQVIDGSLANAFLGSLAKQLRQPMLLMIGKEGSQI